MRLTHILFDADDTLFDYKKAARQVLADTLGGFGIEWSPELNSVYQDINQGLWKKREQGLIELEELQSARFSLFLDKIGEERDAEAMNSLYLSRLSELGRMPLPGAEETVAELAKHFTLAIVTNGISKVQHARFDTSPISAYMSGLFVSGDMGLKKPDREYFDCVLERLGSPDREKTLIVGDSLTSDIKGGAGAGIRTCWYNPENAPLPPDICPDMEIHDLRELTGLCMRCSHENAK